MSIASIYSPLKGEFEWINLMLAPGRSRSWVAVLWLTSVSCAQDFASPTARMLRQWYLLLLNLFDLWFKLIYFWLIYVVLGCVLAWIQVVCWGIDLSRSLENCFDWYKYLYLNYQSYLLAKSRIWIVIPVGNFFARRCLDGFPCPRNAMLVNNKIPLALSLFVQAPNTSKIDSKIFWILYNSTVLSWVIWA